MKLSKTPLWKKSMLEKLNLYDIRDQLQEIYENGDMYGYDYGEIEGYYNEYKEQFDDLAALAYNLDEAMTEYDVEEHWNDMTVALLGQLYNVLGFDNQELDYFNLLNTFEEEWAQNEAVKRILQMTKKDMLMLFRKVLCTVILFYDIKAAHDCLTSIVEELDERAAIMKRKDDVVNQLYEDLTGKSAEQFDEIVKNMPQRMWVE